jgi:adenylate kinase family enzyme
MSPELTSLELTSLGPRLVIVGNSGSGKSTLARLLESCVGGERTDLDHIHWLGKVGVKRNEGEAKELVAALAAKPNWIIEGVYGWLAEAALPRATALIWLDMSPDVCRESLALRGPWRDATAEEHAEFLAWAEAYWLRKTSTSFGGHLALFDGFGGFKRRFTSRAAVAEFVATMADPRVN